MNECIGIGTLHSDAKRKPKDVCAK